MFQARGMGRREAEIETSTMKDQNEIVRGLKNEMMNVENTYNDR